MSNLQEMPNYHFCEIFLQLFINTFHQRNGMGFIAHDVVFYFVVFHGQKVLNLLFQFHLCSRTVSELCVHVIEAS